MQGQYAKNKLYLYMLIMKNFKLKILKYLLEQHQKNEIIWYKHNKNT